MCRKNIHYSILQLRVLISKIPSLCDLEADMLLDIFRDIVRHRPRLQNSFRCVWLETGRLSMAMPA